MPSSPSPAAASSPPLKPMRPSTKQAENGKEDEDDEQDDYLTMTFAEPASATSTTTESLTQATKRKQREAEMRGRPKSKAELAAEEARKREEGLTRSTLDPSSKGFQMMAKLGYKPGSTLGRTQADGRGLLEPVGVEMKEGRGGIGADAEKKRKVREELEARAEGEKRVKVDELDFRERQRLEREERRRAGQIVGAQRVAEGLEEEERQRGDPDAKTNRRAGQKSSTPLGQINVLWRGAVKQRELAERDKRMRHDLQQSLSRLPTYDDTDEDRDDKLAFGRKEIEEVDLHLDQEDPELDEFDELDSIEKLQRLVHHLRESWYYCFWCKYRYTDSNMEGCPGMAEDDHD